MCAVVRSYTGAGAKALVDLLEERKADVEAVIGTVEGLVSYILVRTEAGGFTVTVCQDKAGTDESIAKAREWVQANAAGVGASPPSISGGEVVLHLG